jgi:hexosaminidase
MKTITYPFLLCLFLLTAIPMAAQRPSLIPAPAEVSWGEGSYTLTAKTTIGYADQQLAGAAGYLQKLLNRPTGFTIKTRKGKGNILLSLSKQNGVDGSYTLQVTPQGVVITGVGYRGVINGISTLRQLLPAEIESAVKVAQEWTVPCVNIVDRPAFPWRGMELDVSRHFFSKQEVEELLDVMALYKLNKLHWHLTDDQGWRIEIKKYPLLTENAGWRIFNNQDSICQRRAVQEDNPDFRLPADKIRVKDNGQQQYGGYYTQADIRNIVAYASQRGIDILPEIDMPGHFMSAIANYEGLSCFPRIGWGALFSTPLCPGKDRAIAFCKDIYREVFSLFPYEYVHIGGDEVDMTNWKKCPDCQQRMRENGLKTEPQLQAWFIHQMEQFFNANGRKMIGWDEIIEGGLSATSTVHWWRSWSPKVMQDATAHGNRVICSPNAQFYLDYGEDRNSIPSIYGFNPYEGAADSSLVLGVQGNLWTEWVPTRERMLYMAFPREIAVAERGWSLPTRMNLDDFQNRLLQQLPRLQQMKVTYRTPSLEGFRDVNVFTDTMRVNVHCADPSAIIRYTTDGSMPNEQSARYVSPFAINRSTDFTFRTFDYQGRRGEIFRCRYVKEDYAPAIDLKTDLKDGLDAEWHDFAGGRCADIDKAPLQGHYVTRGVEIPQEVKGNIGLILTGYLYVPADDIYTFSLLSDDGSYLMLDGKMTVDNDGEHSPVEKVGQHAMQAGWHPLLVRYFDHNGGTLSLKVSSASLSAQKQTIAFKHESIK